MQFLIQARCFKAVPSRFTICDAWDIAESELSPNGRLVIDLLADDASISPSLRHDAVWGGQALLEFQDLQALPIPTEGRFFNVNYLFCEGLSVFREAVVCGLNGQIHSSLAALRSAAELFTFHYWWKQRLFGAALNEEFYDWLNKRKGDKDFSTVIRDLYARLVLPKNSVCESKFRELYKELCSYAHKPLLKEAINTIRGGNQNVPNHDVVLYWLSILCDVQRAVLEIAISQTPHALYPLELHTKFGFNPPIGLFFDHSNFLALREALGSEVTASYQANYRTQDPPKSQIEWYEALPDLTPEEILASWKDEEEIVDEAKPSAERIFFRYSLMKAKMRALMWGWAYSQDAPDIAELGRRVRAGDSGTGSESKKPRVN